MTHPDHADLEALLEVLARAKVAFTVVGGAAAVIHGAPITTLDLDVVYQASPGNIDRLMGVLHELAVRGGSRRGRAEEAYGAHARSEEKSMRCHRRRRATQQERRNPPLPFGLRAARASRPSSRFRLSDVLSHAGKD